MTAGILPEFSGNASCAYDAAGNTVSDGTHSFTYDDSGRYVSVAGAATGSYDYNALGQRVKKTVGGVTTYFAYDDDGFLIGEYDGAGALIQEIVWLGDIPVASIRPDGGGGIEILYIHSDHLNTVPTNNSSGLILLAFSESRTTF